jgi:rubrerythrin
VEVLSKIFSLILVVVLISLLPLQYLFGHQLLLFDAYAEDEAVQLVDEIREKRYLDVDMYEGFLKRLSVTGVSYDIELEHAIPKSGSNITKIEELPGVLVVSSELDHLPSISSFTAHTHTDDCYAGHRHISPYGTNDISNVKIYTHYQIMKYYPDGYWNSIDFHCGDCNKIIYTIRYYNTGSSSPYKGYTILYSYNSAGVATETRNYFDIPGRIRDRDDAPPKWSAIANYIDSIVSWNYNNGARSANDRMSYIRPFPFDGLSVWDTDGDRTVLPFTGCTYEEGHPNPLACHPSGDMTKKVNVEYYTSSEPDLTYYNVNVTCATCNNLLFNVSGRYYGGGSHGGAGYSTSYSLTRYKYSTTGTRTSERFAFGSSNVTGISEAAGAYLRQYFNYCRTLPNQTIDADRPGLFKAKATNVNWTMTNLPYVQYNEREEAGGIIGSVPWIGCVYCGAYGANYSCGQVQDETFDCNKVVMSITPTNPTQTVDKGGTIVTTATATYLDGHTGIVNGTSNFNPNQIGVQTVTLTYSGLVGNAKTTGTRTCTVNVTVRETNIPSYLTVTPSSNNVYNGTEPTYMVVVTYMNGNTKTITSGYTKTGWSTGYGMKTVTFSYTENGKTVTCSININVKPNIVSIEVTPAQQTVERYKEPSFTVKAWYEDGAYSYVSGYTTSGFNKNTISTQSVTIQYKENLITRSSSASVIVTPMKVICSQCGNEYFLDENDFDQGCPICKTTVTNIQVAPAYITVARNEPLGISVIATFADGHTEEVTGWTSNYDSSKSGSQLVMVTYLGKYAFINVTVVDKKICSICGNSYSLNEDGTDPGCPICKEYLVSISATPDNQILEKGEDLSLTVIGLYRDGHSATVLGWSSNYDKDIAGEQQITVYYKNLTCNVRVNVVSEDEVQCSICGNYYNYRDNPWGCPLCSGTVTRIEAKLLSGGTRTSYGEALELSIILYYRDGHREMVYGGWQDNFEPFQLGEQDVTITYMDVFHNTSSCILNVNVVNTLTQVVCENGHVYYAEDGECPYCAADKGYGISLYSDCHFTDEILNELYNKEIYNFAEGDYISIKVNIRTEGSIYSMGLFRKNEGITPITYGGEVA